MSVAVLRGDAAHLPLPDGSVDLIVTSPPYFGLRSYTDGGEHYEGQIGSERTPREYVDALLSCTREWMRVLKPEGSLFVNLGDSYYSAKGNPGPNGTDPKQRARRGWTRAVDQSGMGFPRKTLLGVPWRYALGCIDDLELTLRAEIIWDKPNGLPESVTDRVRRSHEQVFHFTKQPRYFTAVDEIREPHTMRPQRRPSGRPEDRTPRLGQPKQTWPTAQRDEIGVDGHPLGKLPGSVWPINSQPLTVPAHLDVDHFAAYPMELPRRIIKGWSPPGICAGCNQGRRPVPDSAQLDMSRPQARRAHRLAERAGLTEAHFAALLSVGISDTGRGAATQAGTGKSTPEVYRLADEARTALGGYSREYLLGGRPPLATPVPACDLTRLRAHLSCSIRSAAPGRPPSSPLPWAASA